VGQVRTGARPVLRIVGSEGWRYLVEDSSGLLRELLLGWSARGNLYLLDISELAYVVYKGLADVLVDGEPIDLGYLYFKLPTDEYGWAKFTVLLDLRERGRRARSGYSPRELLYVKGSERVLVLVLEENTLIEASSILDWVRSALMRGCTPVVAVVDAHGDVTYYAASVVRSSDLSRVYEGEGSSRAGEGD
jgi:tRNA splicing endonuclease